MKKIKYILACLLGGGASLLGASTLSNTQKAAVSSLTTTETGSTTIKTIVLSAPTSTYHIIADVVANGVGDVATSSLGGGFHCEADFKLTGSATTNTVSQLGSTICDINESGGIFFNFATSSASVLAQVNGLPSSTFNWKSFIQTYPLK